MTNPLRGETTFEVEGKTYALRFTWNAAVEFEEVAGCAITDAFNDTARARASAKKLRAMIWAGLREKHPEVTLASCGELMDKLERKGRGEATRILGVALRYYFPELEPDETDPPSPAPRP